MFRQISWSIFFGCVAAVATLYYVAVFVFFYKGRVLNLSLSKLSFLKSNKKVNPISNDDLVNGNSNVAGHLYDKLTTHIDKAGKIISSKEEFLFGLKSFLVAHQSELSTTAISKADINDHILKTAESICSIHLSEKDLRVLWV